MSLRGQTAVVGIGELPTRREYPGRTSESLCAEAVRLAIEDAGLRKSDIDGLVTRGGGMNPIEFADYIRIRPTYMEEISMHGASGSHGVAAAAAAIAAGYANYVILVYGGTRDPQAGGTGGDARGVWGGLLRAEWEGPYGPVVAANGGYALIKQRHMFEYGTTQEQFAKIAADQRFNAQANPNAVFYGQPATIKDVLESRMIADPLHLLECVMPCAGALTLVMTSTERAKSLPNTPVYVLGVGANATDRDPLWTAPRITQSPVVVSSRNAYEMAGYGPRDMQSAQFYD